MVSPQILLVYLAILTAVASVGCTCAAVVIFVKRFGFARLLEAFAFARFYYGDLRREQPAIFFGSIGGMAILFVSLIALFALMPKPGR